MRHELTELIPHIEPNIQRNLVVPAPARVQLRAGLTGELGSGKTCFVRGLARGALDLAGGARVPRDLPLPGRELDGIHQAMEYLPLSNRVVAANRGAPADSPISARGRHVVIIGGGDTGADCLGTAHRQGALEVHQLEILPRPPDQRAEDNPWPQWPNIFRVSSAHEEGGERVYSVSTQRFVGEGGRVVGLVPIAASPSVAPSIPCRASSLECNQVVVPVDHDGPATQPVITIVYGVHRASQTPKGTLVVAVGGLGRVTGVFYAALLIGVDLKKDPRVLHAAYNDSRGITAAFNLNLLTRINRELDGTFQSESGTTVRLTSFLPKRVPDREREEE